MGCCMPAGSGFLLGFPLLVLRRTALSVPYLLRPFSDARPTTTSYRPILPAAIMLRAFLRLQGFIAVLRLREFEIPTLQIHGGFFLYYNQTASGARIRELRIAKNFTQDDLAEHMNVSHGFISLIESGKKGCSVDVLIALSNLFGVSIDYIVLGTVTYTAPDSAALKADIQALIGQLEKFREQL